MAQNLAIEEDDIEQKEILQGQYLTFDINNEIYGLEIFYVTEIIGMQSITPVPEVPSYIKGLINLRGTIVPVIDMRLRFGEEEGEYDERTCIVVINKDDVPVGLIVDAVQEVANIKNEDIVKPATSNDLQGSVFVKGIDKTNDSVRLLIDIDCIYDIFKNQKNADELKEAPKDEEE